MFPVTGVGSRKTPPHILKEMTQISKYLHDNCCFVRTGNAIGADRAFSFGSPCIIYAPTEDTFIHPKAIFNETKIYKKVTKEALEMALKYHPKPGYLKSKPYVHKLMARNMMQVLGYKLDCPSLFLICWTPDGAETRTSMATGGTGQAIRVAIAHNIPVINMCNPGYRKRIEELTQEQYLKLF